MPKQPDPADPKPETLAEQMKRGSDAGPAAIPRPEGEGNSLEEAVERASRHAPTPKP